jgi:hypothetical protein
VILGCVPLVLSAFQHCLEDFFQRAEDMHDGDRLTGAGGFIHQPFGVLAITEGRIEYHLCVLGNAGELRAPCSSPGFMFGENGVGGGRLLGFRAGSAVAADS